MSKEIKIYFVLPNNCEDENSTSQIMRQAFELCCRSQMIPEWVKESNCTTLELGKKDIIVFDKFEGESFQTLKNTKCLIAGPWCIVTCLLEGLPVPNNRSPIYNMAMNKLTITASNFKPDRKLLLKEKIEMMGGIFTLQITSSVTHLITDSVRTEKYVVANEKNMMVMMESWVHDVWETNLTKNVKATDKAFLKHKCPIFQNLLVSCTGFEANVRNKLIKLITENGGSYSGKLITSATHILICSVGCQSQKLKVARNADLPCLLIDWVYDSIEKGYALPENDYVIKMSCSTPTKSKAPLNVDFSMMSAISGFDNNDAFKTQASDTMNNSLYTMDQTISKKSPIDENKVSNILNNIDFKQVKQAGTFLDGCGVYLVGFNLDEREKLCRILKSAGATRYDEISDRVTHVIAGNMTNDVRALLTKGCVVPLVSLEWLTECINQCLPVSEEPFIFNSNLTTNAPPSSPLSKKGLTLLQHNISANMNTSAEPVEAEPKAEEDESYQLYMPKNKTEQEADTLAQLLMLEKVENIMNKDENQTNHTEDETKKSESTTIDGFFRGNTFKLVDHAIEDLEKVTSAIEDLEGEIVSMSYKGITDYVVVPPICKSFKHTATEVVNNLWILECHFRQELLPLNYYHQPIYSSLPLNTLKDCVITISGYAGFERTFLIKLTQHLGATYQDRLARVEVAEHNIKATTHLICLEAIGSKYSAALRWKKLVVTHKWLICCSEQGIKCDETLFTLSENTNNTVVTVPKQEPTVETPVLQTNKRDCEGRRISPLPNEIEINNDYTSNKENTSVKKSKSDLKLNVSGIGALNDDDNEDMSFLCSGNNQKDEMYQRSNSPEIIVEGGRKVKLNKFMEELRNQGLFDTPSPAPKLNAGTPINEVLTRLRDEGKIRTKKNDTPSKLNFKDPNSSSGSQGTPVGRYLRSLQERNVLSISPSQNNIVSAIGMNKTPDSPEVRPFYDIKTPETPLGRFLGEDDPSKSTKKRWQRYLDKIPQYKCHERPSTSKPKRPEDPWFDFKKQAWAWLLRDKSPTKDTIDSEEKDSEESTKEQPGTSKIETESQRELSNQIDQFQHILRKRNSSTSLNGLLRLDGTTPQKEIIANDQQYAAKESAKGSQADTVGWDEPIESNIFDGQMTGETSSNFVLRKFMLSALDQTIRTSCFKTIKSLGSEVSDLAHYDESATHVVCSNPTRNEKILSSMAAGKWIVHYSYIEESAHQGRFINEELYEFGNPKATENLSKFIEKTAIMEAMHWWRIKVTETKKGAFHGMRALVFSKNKPAIIRLIEAGGGVILQVEPPFDHNLDVTHCFIDAKQKLDISDFIPLTEQGIPCLNVLYLSNYLNNQGNVQINDFIMPTLRDYYK